MIVTLYLNLFQIVAVKGMHGGYVQNFLLWRASKNRPLSVKLVDEQ